MARKEKVPFEQKIAAVNEYMSNKACHIRHDEEQNSLYHSGTSPKEGIIIIWIKLDIEKRIYYRDMVR